jgi:hypothetical protein
MSVGVVLLAVGVGGVLLTQLWLEVSWRRGPWWDATEFTFAHLEARFAQWALAAAAAVGAALLLLG